MNYSVIYPLSKYIHKPRTIRTTICTFLTQPPIVEDLEKINHIFSFLHPSSPPKFIRNFLRFQYMVIQLEGYLLISYILKYFWICLSIFYSSWEKNIPPLVPKKGHHLYEQDCWEEYTTTTAQKRPPPSSITHPTLEDVYS